LAKERLRTLIDLIRWGQDYFHNKGIESPRLTIELMLSHILSCSRMELYLQFDRPLNDSQLDILKKYVNRRLKFEPLQYIFGETTFYGRKFKCDSRALIPRPETEILVEKTLKICKELGNKLNILEIGTGTGCIAISLAMELPESRILATDINDDTLLLAKENLEQYTSGNVELIKNDFLLDELDYGNFDVIVSNPPYIPLDKMLFLEKSILNFEPKISLTDNMDGLTFYKKFSETILKMKEGSVMLLEIDGRNTDKLLKLFKNPSYNVIILKDFADLDRIIILRKNEA